MDKIRSYGLKLQQKKFRMEIRKTFLSMRAFKHWKELPREGVGSPSLGVFKSRLDKFIWDGLVEELLP